MFDWFNVMNMLTLPNIALAEDTSKGDTTNHKSNVNIPYLTVVENIPAVSFSGVTSKVTGSSSNKQHATSLE